MGFQLAGEDVIDCFESYEGDQGWVFSWPGRTKSIALSHMKGTEVGFSFSWPGRTKSIALSHMKGTKVGFSVGRGGRNRLL